MDSKDTLRLETNPVRKEDKETDHRRGDTQRDRDRNSTAVSDMSRYYEEIGDDLRRRERMAEAMYEC